MQVLVHSPGNHCVAQEAAFFMEEENGISLHFATKSIAEDNVRIENWYKMLLKADFI